MNELIEEERTQLVGPKGKNDRARGPKRHGSRRAQVVLGGRKVPAGRPRRHVSRLDGWRDKRVKPRRRVLQSRSRRRPELARTTRG